MQLFLCEVIVSIKPLVLTTGNCRRAPLCLILITLYGIFLLQQLSLFSFCSDTSFQEFIQVMSIVCQCCIVRREIGQLHFYDAILLLKMWSASVKKEEQFYSMRVSEVYSIYYCLVERHILNCIYIERYKNHSGLFSEQNTEMALVMQKIGWRELIQNDLLIDKCIRLDTMYDNNDHMNYRINCTINIVSIVFCVCS